MDKQDINAALRRELTRAAAIRQASKNDAAMRATILAIKKFQSERMASTHADLLQSAESHSAAEFFLTDLYGTRDLTQRDADIERIIPVMARLLPEQALQTIADALLLDGLSESLDVAMAGCLGATFRESDYVEAYCVMTRRRDRERQIELIQSVGTSLCNLIHAPLIGSTLKLMRGPARMAGLGELHDFLERGFQAFKKMRQPEQFVATIVARETIILENIYAQRDRPFAL